jgi:hypothetical protein
MQTLLSKIDALQNKEGNTNASQIKKLMLLQ